MDIARVDTEFAAQLVIERARKRGMSGSAVHLCNVYTLALSVEDAELFNALERGWLRLCDSTPISWLLRGGFGEGPPAVRGTSLLDRTLEKGIGLGVTHLFYGADEATARVLVERVEGAYPGISIARAYAPKFGVSFAEHAAEVAALAEECSADIVWVGLGTPRQDHVCRLASQLSPRTFIAVGAALGFLAGTKREAPEWLRNSGLEWTFRLLTEPKRLWRRYTVYSYRFLKALVSTAR